MALISMVRSCSRTRIHVRARPIRVPVEERSFGLIA